MRATAGSSPVSAERRSAEAAAVSVAATPNRADTPERASTAGDSRTLRVNRATTSSRKSGTIAATCASCRITPISSSSRSG